MDCLKQLERGGLFSRAGTKIVFINLWNFLTNFASVVYQNDWSIHSLMTILEHVDVFFSLFTPAKTLSISGLKSWDLKLSFLSLKMMAKSCLEFILKFTKPLHRYLLSCQANLAIMGRYYCTGQHCSNSEGAQVISK